MTFASQKNQESFEKLRWKILEGQGFFESYKAYKETYHLFFSCHFLEIIPRDQSLYLANFRRSNTKLFDAGISMLN